MKKKTLLTMIGLCAFSLNFVAIIGYAQDGTSVASPQACVDKKEQVLGREILALQKSSDLVEKALAPIPLLDEQDVPSVEKSMGIVQELGIEELVRPQNLARPERCPMKSVSKTDVLDKLKLIAKELKNGKCENKNKQMFEGFNQILDQADQYAMYNNPEQYQDEVGKRYITERNRSILNLLTSISHDEECVYNIRERGLLPVVADAVTNVSAMGAVIPNPNGLLMASGGMAIGATLKVINGLLAPAFNWREERDRKQFIDLNCSFFEVRRELEAANIFKMKESEIPAKLEATKAIFEKLKDKLEGLKKEKSEYLAKVETVKSHHLKGRVGEQKFQLKRKISDLLSELEKSGKDNPLLEIDILVEKSPEILRLLKESRSDVAYVPYVQDMLGDLAADRLKNLNAMKKDDFHHQYLEPLKLYLKKLENIYKKGEDEELKSWSTAQRSPEAKSNEAILKAAEKNYDQMIQNYSDMLAKANNRIEILKTGANKKFFDAHDNGAHVNFDVLQEYNSVMDLIYGNEGWSYLQYLLREGEGKEEDFIRGFNKFQKKYPQVAKGRDLRPKDLSWACRDANYLQVTWEAASSSLEVAYDYLQTNVGIFHSNVHKWRTFLFIPVGRSGMDQLRRSVRSAEIAKNIIDGVPGHYRKDLKKYGRWPMINMGKIMLKLKDLEKNRRIVEDFFDKNNCKEHI